MTKVDIQKKYAMLKNRLKELGKVIVAYSGGVDSTLLLRCAVEVLGNENVLAVTAGSEMIPASELNDATAYTKDNGIAHLVIAASGLHEINEKGNPPDRCYHCKKSLFLKITAIAEKRNFTHVIEGSNTDDDNDYRPGKKALEECGVLSPLREAGLGKEEIRKLSKAEHLPSWDKPARACLVSRFPYYMTIHNDMLKKVERAEEFLIEQGFTLCRVRCFGDKALIEVEKTRVREARRILQKIESVLHEIGFREVEIDPDGYRTGRMNVFNEKE
ncbi:MAG: ATP-dependent sacrificial sulfur transferase LarE [Spirochaetales bacterium]|nr:ATP-dependent sacrificial sulfur transferase LarE [Spirochaetales bacterium]